MNYQFRCPKCSIEVKKEFSIKDILNVICERCKVKMNVVMGRSLIYLDGKPLIHFMKSGERGELRDPISEMIYAGGKTQTWSDFKNEEWRKGNRI